MQTGCNAIRACRQQPRLELELSRIDPQGSRRLELKGTPDPALTAVAKGLNPDLGDARIDVVDVHRPEIVFRIAERCLGDSRLEHGRRRVLRDRGKGAYERFVPRPRLDSMAHAVDHPLATQVRSVESVPRELTQMHDHERAGHVDRALDVVVLENEAHVSDVHPPGQHTPTSSDGHPHLIGAVECQRQQAEVHERVDAQQVDELQPRKTPKHDSQPARKAPRLASRDAVAPAVPSTPKPSHSSSNARAGPQASFRRRAQRSANLAHFTGISGGQIGTLRHCR